jgi:hypothetical protein
MIEDHSLIIAAACIPAAVVLDWASYQQVCTILEVARPGRSYPPYRQTPLSRKVAIAGAGALIGAYALTDYTAFVWTGMVLWLCLHGAIYAGSQSRSQQ